MGNSIRKRSLSQPQEGSETPAFFLDQASFDLALATSRNKHPDHLKLTHAMQFGLIFGSALAGFHTCRHGRFEKSLDRCIRDACGVICNLSGTMAMAKLGRVGQFSAFSGTLACCVYLAFSNGRSPYDYLIGQLTGVDDIDKTIVWYLPMEEHLTADEAHHIEAMILYAAKQVFPEHLSRPTGVGRHYESRLVRDLSGCKDALHLWGLENKQALLDSSIDHGIERIQKAIDTILSE